MGDAARLIHWNGTDVPLELADLPPGHYRLVATDDRDFDLTPEEEAAIEQAMADIDAGRGVSLEAVDARLRATIASRSRGSIG